MEQSIKRQSIKRQSIKRQPWSDKEIAFIREQSFNNKKPEEIFAMNILIGRSLEAIVRVEQLLRVTKNYKLWTTKDIILLESEMEKKTPVKDICLLFPGRSPSSVAYKIHNIRSNRTRRIEKKNKRPRDIKKYNSKRPRILNIGCHNSIEDTSIESTSSEGTSSEGYSIEDNSIDYSIGYDEYGNNYFLNLDNPWMYNTCINYLEEMPDDAIWYLK